MDTGQPWGCRGLIHPWEINWERDGKPSLFFQSPAQGEHAGGAQGECPGGQGWGERQSVGSGTAAWAPLTLGAANVLPQHFSSALSIRESILALVVNLRGASRLPAPAVRTATHSPSLLQAGRDALLGSGRPGWDGLSWDITHFAGCSRAAAKAIPMCRAMGVVPSQAATWDPTTVMCMGTASRSPTNTGALASGITPRHCSRVPAWAWPLGSLLLRHSISVPLGPHSVEE